MPTKEEIAKKNISFTSVNEVNEICKPLFQRFNINRFSYYIYCHDTSHYGLDTSEWSTYYFLNKYPAVKFNTPFFPNCLYFDEDCIERGYMAQEAIIERQASFGLYHTAYIATKKNNYWELWIFNAPQENYQIIDIYLRKFDLLEQFVLYFKDKASKLIQQAERDRIMIPSRHYDLLWSSSDNEIYTEDQKQFLCEIEHKKFYVCGNNGEIALTKREFEVFKCNAFGMTAKEIARSLNISPRTTEIYLDRIKQKLGIYGRHRLTKVFFDNCKIKN